MGCKCNQLFYSSLLFVKETTDSVLVLAKVNLNG